MSPITIIISLLIISAPSLSLECREKHEKRDLS